MKIERSPVSVAQINDGARSKKTDKEQPVSKPSVVTHFSNQAAPIEESIDFAKVNEVKEAIANGTFKIDADKIAKHLIDHTIALLE